MSNNFLVSAIVSTYNSKKFIQGCLEDLLAQSLYKKGLLEIVVIDSASFEDEQSIVNNYIKNFKNISYFRLDNRVTLYEAWNIGIEKANGDFITNANADDRHHPECLEILHSELEKNINIDLVYADVFATKTPNLNFENITNQKRYNYKSYFAPDSLLHYQFGCQPMWRKSAHKKIGFFNPLLKAAGDYEFNLRFALKGLKALHIQKTLGLFLENKTSISLKDSSSIDEQAKLRSEYISVDNILKLYENEGFDISSSKQKANVLHNLSLKALNFRLPWEPGGDFFDIDLAICCLNGALNNYNQSQVLLNNFAVMLQKIGKLKESYQILMNLPNNHFLPEIQRNYEKAKEFSLDKFNLEISNSLSLD